METHMETHMETRGNSPRFPWISMGFPGIPWDPGRPCHRATQASIAAVVLRASAAGGFVRRPEGE